MSRLLVPLILICILPCLLDGQPSVIFNGGKGQGYTLQTENSSFVNVLAQGGEGQGYSLSIFASTSENVLVKGGKGAGYILVELTDLGSFYLGGEGQGYTLSNINSTNELVISLGGPDDGYSMELNFSDFIWTGNEGPKWNNPANWNSVMVPDLNRKAIIPPVAKNWPVILSGVLAIGDNPNSGAYMAEELWIQNGAELTTDPDSSVENFGTITIDGLMTIQSTKANTFVNFPGSTLNILDIGILMLNPF